MRTLLALLLCVGLTACQKVEVAPIALPSVRNGGDLVVITRNSPTTFFEDAEGKFAGLEHDLAEMFAKDLGVPVKFIVVKEFDQTLAAVEKQQAHLAAAGLSITPERQKKARFAPPYQTVQQQVAYNTANKKPADLKELVGKRIEVMGGSSYAERLKEAKKRHPGLAWQEVPNQDSEELLEKLTRGDIDIVIADSNIIGISRNFNPNIDVAFDLGEPESLAWAFSLIGDDYVFHRAQEFFARIKNDGTLKRLLDRYYGHIKRLERADVEGFLTAVNGELPRFRRMFQSAQEDTELDWRLIAAVGYQESHWNPLATSPTGVRGLMMLTSETADRMNVTDRLDAKQNIRAGAEYLLNLKDSLPARIPDPDRTWMALAAYNVGYGHLEDARVLAQKLKLNPDSWLDLKTTLPLLARAEYRDTVKHGYARGGETVIFVENVRTYYDILTKFEKPHKTLLAEPGFSHPPTTRTSPLARKNVPFPKKSTFAEKK